VQVRQVSASQASLSKSDKYVQVRQEGASQTSNMQVRQVHPSQTDMCASQTNICKSGKYVQVRKVCVIQASI